MPMDGKKPLQQKTGPQMNGSPVTAGDGMKGMEFTARFKIEHAITGRRYVFFCDLSGMPVYATGPIREQDPQRAEIIARTQARPYFNRCSECGKWVGDADYNIDEMKCVACAPYVPDPESRKKREFHLVRKGGFCVCGVRKIPERTR